MKLNHDEDYHNQSDKINSLLQPHFLFASLSLCVLLVKLNSVESVVFERTIIVVSLPSCAEETDYVVSTTDVTVNDLNCDKFTFLIFRGNTCESMFHYVTSVICLKFFVVT